MKERAGFRCLAAAWVLAAAVLSSCAAAEEPGRFELGVFGGASIGTRISLTPQAEDRIGDAAAWGLRGAYWFDRRFSLEASFSLASPKIRTRDPRTGNVYATSSLDSTTIELEGLYNFGKGPVRGYFGLGAGLNTLDPLHVSGGNGRDTMFVYNAALGARFDVTDALSLRLDGRYRWRITDKRLGTVVCLDSGCHTYTTTFYSSPEVTAGLSYRFGEPLVEPKPSFSLASSGSERNFWAAAGGVVLMELVPWGTNRYLAKSDFAYISMDTVRANFQNGFGFDRDAIRTNQSSHPFHGGLFFNAGRSNGFTYWESGLFSLAGSFSWEMLMEKEPPAFNDIVNTTLGGMDKGEIQHRLSKALLDNTVSGSSRFWRELGAFALNPMGGFYRFVRGEMTQDAPNPDDRFPSAFRFGGALGYRHVSGAESPDQAVLSIQVDYGDPFAGEIKKPFDSFTVGLDLTFPGGAAMSRVEQRGILKGWELTEPTEKVRHIFAFSQAYEYLNNESQVFGAEILGAGLLSRFEMAKGLHLTTDVMGFGFPLAAIETTNQMNPISGRTYDFAPGGGLRAAARLERKGEEIASASYSVAWSRTADGTAWNNTQESLRLVGRIPLTRKLGVGAAYSWYERHTTYKNLPEVWNTQNEVRVFGTWKFL